MADAIVNPGALRRWAALGAAQIVAHAMFMDSNGSQTDPAGSPDSGVISGWLDAYPRALAAWLGSAGTGVVGLYNNLPLYHGISPGGSGIANNTASVPSSHAGYLLPATITAGNGVTSVTSGFCHHVGVAYVANGASVAANDTRTLLSLASGGPLVTVNEAVIACIRYGTFAGGSGNAFWPSVRREASADLVKASTANINVVTGANGLADAELAVAAAARNYNYHLEPTELFSHDWAGPGLVLSSQLVRAGVTSGVTSSPGLLQGGLGGVEAATSVMTASLAALGEWLRAMVYPQIRLGQAPSLLVQWLHGGNDRNDGGQASYDPDTGVRNGADSSTPTGVYNNALTLYRRLLAAWVAQGYAADRLFLALGPYHEQSAHVATLASYEAALAGICTLYPATCWLTRGTELFDAASYDAADWYRDGAGEDTDDAHLRRDGYHASAMQAVGAWRGAALDDASLASLSARVDGILVTLAGTLDANVGSISPGVITTDSFAAGAIDSTVAPKLDVPISTRLAPATPGRALTVAATGEAAVNLVLINGSDAGVAGVALIGKNYDLHGVLNCDLNGHVRGIVQGDSAIATGQAGAFVGIGARSHVVSLGAGTINPTVAPNLDVPVSEAGGGAELTEEQIAAIGAAAAAALVGTGPHARTITVTSGGSPVSGARVSMAAGAVTYSAVTNSSGVASFSLDAGTYTLAVAKSGYSHVPATVTVAGAGNTATTLTAIAITPAADPGQTNAYTYTYDAHGAVEGGVTLTFRLDDLDAGQEGEAESYPRTTFTATSNGSGLLQVTLRKSTSYKGRRDRGDWIDFTTGSDGTYALPKILGKPAAS